MIKCVGERWKKLETVGRIFLWGCVSWVQCCKTFSNTHDQQPISFFRVWVNWKLCNEPLKLDVASHLTSLNQSEWFISEQLLYSDFFWYFVLALIGLAVQNWPQCIKIWLQHIAMRVLKHWSQISFVKMAQNGDDVDHTSNNGKIFAPFYRSWSYQTMVKQWEVVVA